VLRRATALLLEADTANVGAIALYESQGFQRTVVRANYYKPGHDALLLELRW
jgi:ribosomal-protein-alanine N-acetyltransferase